MSLFHDCIARLGSYLGDIAGSDRKSTNPADRTGKRANQRRRRSRLTLEQLESRELLATDLMIDGETEPLVDSSPSLTLADAFKALDGTTSDFVHWSESAKVDDARLSTLWDSSFQNGLAAECLIALANELDSDPWFNMPHLADDDYVRQFATAVRELLESDQKIYFEWSDEVWFWAPSGTLDLDALLQD